MCTATEGMHHMMLSYQSPSQCRHVSVIITFAIVFSPLKGASGVGPRGLYRVHQFTKVRALLVTVCSVMGLHLITYASAAFSLLIG